MKKLKVFHIVYGFEAIGGLENGLINILNFSDRDKFEHVVCALSKVGPLLERVKNEQVAYYSLNKKNGNDPFLPIKIFKILLRERPDVVHMRNWPTMVEGYVAAKMARIKKIVYSEHGRHFESVWNNQKVKTKIIRHILHNVDQCICVSADVAIEMEELYQLKRSIDVIVNGVDCNKFKPINESSISHNHNKFVVGSVGRLDRGKRYDQLIIDSKKFEKDMELIIVGDGPELNRLNDSAKLVKHEGRIKFFGNIDRVDEILRNFNLFVLPSESEGLSNAIMEAMSCGLPVVAYDVGGNSELLKDGRGGFLVENNNRQEFVEKIMVIYSNPELRFKMGNFNRKYVLEKFSLKKMIDKYEQCYLV